MKVNTVEKTEKSTARITVEFSAEEFEKAIETAYRKNRGSIQIPGFRKGKAPRKMVERLYGANVFYEDAAELLCPDAFDQAVQEEKLEVVGQPSISDLNISDEKELTVEFRTALYPEVTLGAYLGLAAPREQKPVTEEDIDQELIGLQKRNARIVSVERPAADGDTVVIDYDGALDGVPFDGGKAEGQSLLLGSGSFVPGFEDQVVGMAVGEEKEISVTFPEDYTPELAGKDVVFKVKLLEVKESVLPELDDEFAKDISEFDTLGEYKESIRTRLEEERAHRAENQFKDAILKQAVSNMEAEIPDVMIDAMSDRMTEEMFYSLSSQGIQPEQYLQMIGMSVQGFKDSNRKNAEARVRTEVLIDKVAEAEAVEVTDEELDAEYEKLAAAYKMDLKDAKEAIAQENVKRQVMLDKAANLIYNSAVICEAAPDDAGEDQAEQSAEAE